jgi:hypothetical protein
VDFDFLVGGRDFPGRGFPCARVVALRRCRGTARQVPTSDIGAGRGRRRRGPDPKARGAGAAPTGDTPARASKELETGRVGFAPRLGSQELNVRVRLVRARVARVCSAFSLSGAGGEEVMCHELLSTRLRVEEERTDGRTRNPRPEVVRGAKIPKCTRCFSFLTFLVREKIRVIFADMHGTKISKQNIRIDLTNICWQKRDQEQIQSLPSCVIVMAQRLRELVFFFQPSTWLSHQEKRPCQSEYAHV